MKVENIFVDGVEVGPRHRALSKDKVTALAESMKEIGLRTPITVWEPNEERVALIAGLHRLEAAKELGWDMIPAYFVAMDEIERELWEIDENLMRADLTPAEEAAHLKRRQELFDERRKAEASGEIFPTSSGGTDSTGKGYKGFAADTAEKTGRDKSGINKAISRAKHIPPDVLNLLVGTPLDKGVYMDKLKQLHPDFEAMKAKVTEDLEAAERKAKSKALQTEAKERAKEAKEARDRARNAACDLLLDCLSPKQWDDLIELIEQAGGSLKAKELRSWQAPSEAA